MRATPFHWRDSCPHSCPFELNLPFPVHLIHWFLKCQCSLAISCLTTSNLSWFMDLTFQVPMQYCSLLHQALISPPDTFTAGLFFLLWLKLFIPSGATSLLFPSSILGTYCPVVEKEMATHSSILAWRILWMEDLGGLQSMGRKESDTTSLSFSLTVLWTSFFIVISFYLFILFMGSSRQECWSDLPFPSPVDNILSELPTKTRPSWLTLCGMPHSFIELDKLSSM